MRDIGVVLFLGFVGTGHARRVRIADQDALRDPRASSFVEISRGAPSSTLGALTASKQGYGDSSGSAPLGIGSLVASSMSTQASPEMASSIEVPGGALRTLSYHDGVEQLQVSLSSEGRPLDADVELWHGPDMTPVKIRLYAEDGKLRPLKAMIATPSNSNTVAVRNIGEAMFPLTAGVIAENVEKPPAVRMAVGASRSIQGGAIRTYPFATSIESVKVLLKTSEGLPLNARIEVLQGPKHIKQVIELYTEDGHKRPFFCELMLPGSRNTVRVINTGPDEVPMTAAVVTASTNPEMMSDAGHESDVTIRGQ